MKKNLINIILIYYIFILNFIFCNDLNITTTSTDSNTTTLEPLQIHLSLTNNDGEIVVTWLTRNKLDQPTVYYYLGDCKDLKDETFETLYGSVANVQVGFGKSETYSKYNGFVHSVLLGNLQSSREYCYSVGGNKIRNLTGIESDKSWSHWRILRTVNSIGSPSIFAALADSGTYGNVFDVSKALSRDPDIALVIHAGDLSYGKVEEKWDLFGDIFEPITSKIPFMVIPGNWDVKDGAIEPFYNRYKMPLPHNKPNSKILADGTIQTDYNLFYSFRYGYVYHIMLSSYDPYTNQSIQYSWLEKELIKANELRVDYPWLVISAHSPMYSSSSGHNGSDTVFRSHLETLFRKYQVNLILSGHDHGYERTYPVFNEYTFTKHPKNYTSTQGTVHIVVGTGGADSDPWLPRPKWTAHRETSSGYTKIIAHKHTLSVIYIRTNNTIGDEFVIINSPPFKSTPHAPFIIIFLIFLIIIFPLCAYNKIPHKIFSSLLIGNRERKDFKLIV